MAGGKLKADDAPARPVHRIKGEALIQTIAEKCKVDRCARHGGRHRALADDCEGEAIPRDVQKGVDLESSADVGITALHSVQDPPFLGFGPTTLAVDVVVQIQRESVVADAETEGKELDGKLPLSGQRQVRRIDIHRAHIAGNGDISAPEP